MKLKKAAKSIWKWGLGFVAMTTGGYMIRKWVLSPKEPRYQVLESVDGFQIREYEPYLVAETLVEGDFETSSNEGFRRLASYISGKNQTPTFFSVSNSKAQTGEKIAMTAPVGQSKQDEVWKITFVMPAHYTITNLPKPTDPRITIRQIPAKRVAVKRFSGFWDENGVKEHIHALEQFLENNLLTASEPPIFARYNPPITPFFLRRNEILIPLTE